MELLLGRKTPADGWPQSWFLTHCHLSKMLMSFYVATPSVVSISDKTKFQFLFPNNMYRYVYTNPDVHHLDLKQGMKSGRLPLRSEYLSEDFVLTPYHWNDVEDVSFNGNKILSELVFPWQSLKNLRSLSVLWRCDKKTLSMNQKWHCVRPQTCQGFILLFSRSDLWSSVFCLHCQAHGILV